MQCVSAERIYTDVQVAASRAAQTLPDFTPQAIANIMWAFAILAHSPGAQLLDAVSKDVHRRLDDFSPQHIAVTLWAFGKLEASPGAVLLQVSHHILIACMCTEFDWYLNRPACAALAAICLLRRSSH